MATGNGTGRKGQTICQKSTAIAANLVRSSSSLLAKITLGSLLTSRNGGGGPAPDKAPPELPQDPIESKVMVQRVERVSPFADDVDSLAAKYIMRFKEKNKPREPAGAVADHGSNRTHPPPSSKRVPYTR